ncbi:MAG: Type I transmembrane sorting receptor [Phylliscum demangeonii]|nr:MAG: Type I transmembrane sorting receptor [Phylliscum demangeonii]
MSSYTTWLLVGLLCAAVDPAVAAALPASSSSPSLPRPSDILGGLDNLSWGELSQMLAAPRGVRGNVVQAQRGSVPAVRSTQRLTSGFEVPAVPNDNGWIFLCQGKAGADSLMMEYDSGSAIPYMLDSSLPADVLNGRKASSGKQVTRLPRKFTLQYQGGDEVDGYVGVTPLVIGKVLMPNQPIGVATSLKKKTYIDGLIGLSTGNVPYIGAATEPNYFLDNLMAALPKPLFAVDFRASGPSSFTFGYYDQSKFQGQLFGPVPVDPSNGQWTFTATGATVGNQYIAGPFVTLVDTGTSIMRVDDRVAQAFWGQVTGAFMSTDQNGWVYPCTSAIPNVGVVIGTYTATVQSDHIRGPQIGSSGFCFGGLQTAGDVGQVLGVVFLKSQYVVFSRGDLSRRDNMWLGFAPHT